MDGLMTGFIYTCHHGTKEECMNKELADPGVTEVGNDSAIFHRGWGLLVNWLQNKPG